MAWRFLLAVLILLLMSLDVPLPGTVLYTLLPITLLVWGCLLVIISVGNLFVGPKRLKLAWTLLAAGAYLTLSIPGFVRGMPSFLDALGPVVALTLVPHLGRRDLSVAMRDWATVMGVVFYAALGVQAMWVLVSSLGLTVFFLAALLPPLLLEALILLMSRKGTRRRSNSAELLLSTILSVLLLGVTQFNRGMALIWFLVFGLVVGLLLGLALLLSLFSRPPVETAVGAAIGTNPLARSLVELSHGPVLISLVLYLPLSLLR